MFYSTKHLLRVGNPRLFDHPYQSPQLPLWEPGEVEWFVILRTDPPVRRRRPRGRLMLLQAPLWEHSALGELHLLSRESGHLTFLHV
jgi:hypothetical protein